MLENEVTEKIKISIEFCKSCDSHNWCTHHDEQKYKQAFIDLENIIRKQFPNIQIVGNETPSHLVPIKSKENKYYDPTNRKYVLFPAIGAFEVYLNDQLIFSKKNTNIWPNNSDIINLIYLKIKGQPRKSIHTNSVILTEKASICISDKQQKQTIKMANSILRSIDNSCQHEQRYRKNNILTDHFKRYKLKNTENGLQTLYSQYQSIKPVRISKITPEDIQKLNQIWGKKQNLPNFIKHKAFIQQNQGKKQMLVNLSSIQQQSQIKQFGPSIKRATKNRLSNLKMQFQNIQNKFLKIQNRVSQVKSKKLQFDTIDEGNHKRTRNFNISDKINQVKTIYNPQKLIQQIKNKKKRKIQQYIHSTSQQKNQKLQQIYGPQYLKPNLVSSKLKFYQNSKVTTKHQQNKKNNHSNSSKMSSSYHYDEQQQDSSSDLQDNFNKKNNDPSQICLIKKNFTSSQSNFRPANVNNKRNIYTREKLRSSPKFFQVQNTMNNFQKQKKSFQSRSVLHKISKASINLPNKIDINKDRDKILENKAEKSKRPEENYQVKKEQKGNNKQISLKTENTFNKSEHLRKVKNKPDRNTISKTDKQKEKQKFIYKTYEAQLKTHKKLRTNENQNKKQKSQSFSSQQKSFSVRNSNNFSNSIMKNNSNVKTNKFTKTKKQKESFLPNNSKISNKSVRIKSKGKQIQDTICAKSQKQSLINTKRSQKQKNYRGSRSVTQRSVNKNKSLCSSLDINHQLDKKSKKSKLNSPRVDKFQSKNQFKNKKTLSQVSKKTKDGKISNKNRQNQQNDQRQEKNRQKSSRSQNITQRSEKKGKKQRNKCTSQHQQRLQPQQHAKQGQNQHYLQDKKVQNSQIRQKDIIKQQNNVIAQSKPRRIYEIDEQRPQMCDIGTQKNAPKKEQQSQTLQTQFLRGRSQKSQATVNSMHQSDDYINSDYRIQIHQQKSQQNQSVTCNKEFKTKQSPKKQLPAKQKTQNAAIVKQFYGQNYKQYLLQQKKRINTSISKIKSPKNKINYIQIGKLYEGEKIKPTLFGKDSIQPQRIIDNTGNLRNFIKVINILSSKNQFLIIRLFQNPQLVNSEVYSVWLCDQNQWKSFHISDYIKIDQESSKIPIDHSGSQRWPVIIVQALAQLFGGYEELFKISVSQLFHALTGSSFINFKIKQDPEKNSKLLKFITSNQKKNFIILAQKRMHNSLGESLQEKLQNTIFYILSQKTVNNNQTLLRMKKANSDAFWIKLQKFVSEFCQVDVLQLRINHNFCFVPLPNTNIGHFKIIQLIFRQESFGCVTFVTESKATDFKIFLYKEEQDNVLRLIGQVNDKNKKFTLFDCCFQQGKYFIFADIKNSRSRICYMGQSQPQIRLKQQIQQVGLKSDFTQYIPINQKVKKKSQQMPKFLNMTKKSQKDSHFGIQSAIRSDNSKIPKIDKQKLRAQFIDYLTSN